MELNQLISSRRKTLKLFEGTEGVEPLEISYVPGLYTLDMLAQSKPTESSTEQDIVQGYMASLLGVRLLWNLKRDGVPVEASGEEIRKLPLFLLNEIIEAVNQDARPKGTESESLSTDGSPQKD